MRTVGVIDVGTNSVLALGIDETDHILFNNYKISELGRGMSHNNMFLYDDSIRKTFIIISQFIDKLHAIGIKDIHIIGTSASREARNITSLQMLVYNKYKLDYRILSGDDEARYTYMGALAGFKDINRHFLMMDIGGGSTELMLGKRNMIIFKHSFDIGAVRLLDQFNCHYRFTKEEFQKVMTHILRTFDKLPNLPENYTFVGIGGTFTTATAIKYELEQYDMDIVNNGNLTINELTETMNTINSADELDRRQITGLEFKRAPYIVYGMLIYITLMKKLGIKRVHTTDYGLRFGYAEYLMKKKVDRGLK